MAERVDLHIGLPNAGTAYLQKLLFDNRETLGVGLVGESPRALDRAAREIAGLGGGAQWQVVADAVSAAPDRILLSCEGFSTADAARAARAVREVANAPVRYLPAALLEALQDSWGSPEEVLGTSPTAEQLTATAT